MIKSASVKPITRNREIPVFKNGFGSLYNDETTGATGRRGHYLRWAWSHRGVVAVPFRSESVALCWMYRYSPGLPLLELPRGMVNNDETPENAALRELAEEAGLTGSRASRLGQIYSDTGLISNCCEVFAVSVDSGRVTNSCSVEPMESIADQVVWLGPGAMSQAIADGDITCAITIAAWAMFRSRGTPG